MIGGDCEPLAGVVLVLRGVPETVGHGDFIAGVVVRVLA
jgi:hypothetical protein